VFCLAAASCLLPLDQNTHIQTVTDYTNDEPDVKENHGGATAPISGWRRFRACGGHESVDRAGPQGAPASSREITPDDRFGAPAPSTRRSRCLWGRGLEHVAQKWEPVLRFSDMRNQKVRVGRVNANERDPL